MNTQNLLQRLLTDERWALPAEEIEKLLDEELAKPVEEIDAAFVAYCMAQTESPADRENAKKKTVRPFRPNRKAFVAVVAAVLLLLGTLTVSAVTGILPTDGIVEFYDEYIRIRFDKEQTTTNNYSFQGSALANELALHGIAPIMLPEAFLTDDYTITSIEYQTDTILSMATVYYAKGNKRGRISIKQYADQKCIPCMDFPDTENYKVDDAQGVEIYVIEQNKKGNITFQNGLTQYFITTPLSFEKAIEFAKTIK